MDRRAILDALYLRVGAKVGLAVQGDRLVIEPQPRLRYALDDLLAECDPTADSAAEDQTWLNSPPTGRELL